MDDEKAIIKWLEEAQADGHKWAQSAINQTSTKERQHQAKSLSDALLGAFNWKDSREGLYFWSNINDKLEEKEQ